jgi:tetratricopeptide (TPR) repeat protein
MESKKGESIVKLLSEKIEEAGIDAAVEKSQKMHQSQKSQYYFDVNELNNFGYKLLKSGNLENAVRIFELNNRLFPDIANTYDSLAEIYIEIGKIEKATSILNEIPEVAERDHTLSEMTRTYFKNRAKYILKHVLGK